MSRRRSLLLGATLLLPFGAGVSLAHSADAHARPGGGSSFSGSRSSSSGGSGSFSSGSRSSSSSFGGSRSSYSGGGGSSSGPGFSGDGDVGLITFMAVTAGVIIFIGVHAAIGARNSDQWSSARSEVDYGNLLPQTFAPKPKKISLAPLRESDPNFSQILLEDFLYELYTRAQQARTSAEELALLAPYLDEKVRNALLQRGAGRKTIAVGGVIVGAMKVVKLQSKDGWSAIEIEHETNYTETIPGRNGQGPVGFYARERWHFVRRIGAQSRTPDETRGFNCPSCGAPVEDSQHDACSHCGAKHGTGEFDWLCNGLQVLAEETRGPALTQYAEEVGTFDPTVVDPELTPLLRELSTHDPEFDRAQLLARVEMIYHELNTAWSSLDWDHAKPYLTDRLWLSLRYWIHAYEQQDLQNLMLAAKVERTELAKVDVDPFFHSITVRLWASAIDHTIHRGTGAVVCGSDTHPRRYSEYWTFIRSAKRKGKASTDKRCPSCGAELKIGMAGNCEYCGVKVTSGDFDWVLSKIEQDEAYLG